MGKFTPKMGFDGKSVNGTVVSSNKNGAILRNRSIPLKSKSPRANVSKSRFKAAVSAWRSLSNTQRSNWNAASFDGLSGFRYYVYVHMNIQLVGDKFRVSVPTVTGDRSWSAVGIRNASIPVGLSVTLNESANLYGLFVFASPQFPNGDQLPNLNRYRLIHIDEQIATEVIDLTSSYIDAFGNVLLGGDTRISFIVVLFRSPGVLKYSTVFTSIAIE